MGLEKKKLALFFTCGISLGVWEGAGILAREIKLYNALAQGFEKIFFVTYGGKNDLRFKKKLAKNIEILTKKISIPAKLYQFFIPFLYRKKLMEADIYKTNQMTASLPAILSKRLYKKKLVVRCGYEWLKFKEKEKNPIWKLIVASLFEKLAYKNADKIVFTSLEDKEFVEIRFKIPSSKITIIPNFIDVDLFRPIKLQKENHGVCFVGRLSAQKNLFNLIKAISVLDIKLVIFGSGPLEEDLKIFAKKLNAQVEFRGNIPNDQLPEELNKSGLFILPSVYEGNPKVLLEAMACGLPCIGANSEGIREIINDEQNGYLFETNVESIRKAILEVLEDISLREKIGQNARKTIMENFSFEKILNKEIQIYHSLQ